VVSTNTPLTAELGFYDRLTIGKADEERQVTTLRAEGFNIEEVSAFVDMKEKIDRRIQDSDGSWLTLQIKGRDVNPTMTTTYKDILIDYYEPYCGLGHEYTTDGRDKVSNYDRFTCRIGSKLYLVDGALQKKVIANVMDEWEQFDGRVDGDKVLANWADKLYWDQRRNEPMWTESRIFKHIKVLYSKQYSNLQVRCTQDRKNRRPKLLIFIPPTIYKSEAQCFEMK